MHTKSKTSSNQFTTSIENDQINETSKIFIENIENETNRFKIKKPESINNQFTIQKSISQTSNASKSNHSERKHLNFFIKNSSQSVQFLKKLIILNPTALNKKKTSFAKNPIFLTKRFRNFHLPSLFHRTNIRSNSSESKQNYQIIIGRSAQNSSIFFFENFFLLFDESENSQQNNFDQQNNPKNDEKRSKNQKNDQIDKNYTSKKNPISKSHITDNLTMDQLTSQMKTIIDQIIEKAVNKTLFEIETNLSDSFDSQNSTENENFANFQNFSKETETAMNESNR